MIDIMNNLFTVPCRTKVDLIDWSDRTSEVFNEVLSLSLVPTISL